MNFIETQASLNGLVLQEVLTEFPIYVQITAAPSLLGCLVNMLLTVVLGMWRETLGKMVIALSIIDAVLSSLWFFKPDPIVTLILSLGGGLLPR